MADVDFVLSIADWKMQLLLGLKLEWPWPEVKRGFGRGGESRGGNGGRQVDEWCTVIHCNAMHSTVIHYTI